MKKLPRSVIIFLAAALGAYALLWGAVNLYIIPKKIIPKVRHYLDTGFTGPVKVRIRDIYFSPFRGFMLKDAEVLLSRRGIEASLLRAPNVNIDLSVFGLLWKRLEIKRFTLSGALINISRDDRGTWNFTPLFDAAPKEANTGSGGWKLFIDKVRVRGSTVEYSDLFKKDNSLRRKFTDVQLFITCARAEVYDVSFSISARSAGRDPVESLEGTLEYDHASSSLNGKAFFKIRHLSEYRTYYLDDILRPWDLASENISGQLRFDSKQDTITVEAEYEIGNGVLRHGDFNVQGDYSVSQKLLYKNGHFEPDASRVQISLKNAVFRAGAEVFIDKAESALVIAKRVMDIQSLTGMLWRRPVILSGRFSFDGPRELSLSGKFDGFDTRFILGFPADNQAQADLVANSGDSRLKLHAVISDLKDLAFALGCEADMAGPQLAELLQLKKIPLAGRLTLTGKVMGEADEPYSYEGGIAVGLDSFSLMGLQPVSCVISTVVQDGVLRGQLPVVTFYEGQLTGMFALEHKRWGFELSLKDLDIKGLSAAYPRLKGLSGTLNGSAACVSTWGSIDDLQGGGYIKMADCDLRLVPMFHATEEGLVQVIKNFVMPVFNEAEGNFQLRGKRILLQNVFCKATNLNLVIKGGYDIGGMSDFTMGVSLFGGGFTRVVKQIFSPFSLGVNLLVNSFEVDIWGKWPELEHRVKMRPQRWLEDFFRIPDKADPKKYSLEKLLLL